MYICMYVCMYELFAEEVLLIFFYDLGWLNWAGLTAVEIYLFVVSIVGMRGANLVSLQILLDYFWASIVIIAPLILVLFSCFNFFSTLDIIFKHLWTDSSFENIRRTFCEPSSDANTLCNFPFYGKTDIEINKACIEYEQLTLFSPCIQTIIRT